MVCRGWRVYGGVFFRFCFFLSYSIDIIRWTLSELTLPPFRLLYRVAFALGDTRLATNVPKRRG